MTADPPGLATTSHSLSLRVFFPLEARAYETRLGRLCAVVLPLQGAGGAALPDHLPLRHGESTKPLLLLVLPLPPPPRLLVLLLVLPLLLLLPPLLLLVLVLLVPVMVVLSRWGSAVPIRSEQR